MARGCEHIKGAVVDDRSQVLRMLKSLVPNCLSGQVSWCRRRGALSSYSPRLRERPGDPDLSRTQVPGRRREFRGVHRPAL
jgi:hypothetical protein